MSTGEPDKDQPALSVQVCHALPDRIFLRDLRVKPGTSVQQAIVDSGLLEQMPGLDLAELKVGIHGKQKSLEVTVRDGDRIEVYRPLIADPKDARRRRAVRESRRKG